MLAGCLRNWDEKELHPIKSSGKYDVNKILFNNWRFESSIKSQYIKAMEQMTPLFRSSLPMQFIAHAISEFTKPQVKIIEKSIEGLPNSGKVIYNLPGYIKIRGYKLEDLCYDSEKY